MSDMPSASASATRSGSSASRPRRYAVLGVGGVGGFYGVRLHQAGHEVHFLARSDYEHIARLGLTLRTAEGDTVLPVKVWNDPAAMPPCDVLIVAFKTTQNAALAQILPQLVHPEATILVLQNGLGSEETILPFVGEAEGRCPNAPELLGGLPFVCASKLAPALVHHIDYGSIAIGSYCPGWVPCGVTAAMEAVARDFREAGVPIDLVEDLLEARWRKLVWNVPFNGLSVVLDASTAVLMADPAIALLAEQLMLEVLAGAKLCGRVIPAEFIDKMLDHTRQMRPYLPSMKLDWDAGRALEVEAIYGNPVRAVQAAGGEMPRVETLYRQLLFLDRRHRSKD